MNSEQKKVRDFFEKFLNKGVQKTLSWIGIVLWIIVLMMLCALPAQETYSSTAESPSIWLPLPTFMSMFSWAIVYLRLSPYTLYGENQKSRLIADILAYHPIDKKEIQKMRRFYLFRLLGKVTAAGLLVQLISAFITYGSVSWMNFAHIFISVFLFPAVGGTLFESFTWKGLGN